MKHRITGLTFLSAFFVSGIAPAQFPVQIHVNIYGAIPNDGGDDLPAIRSAIAALPSSNCELVFAPGTYDLFPVPTLGAPTSTSQSMFDITSKTNLVVQGNGATLMCHEFDPTRAFHQSYYSLFYVWGCTDVEFRDLTVNMSRLPYTMGACQGITGFPTSLGNRNFQVTIDPSFVPQGTSLLTMKIHALCNWRNGYPNGQEFFYVDNTTTGGEFYVDPISNPSLYTIKGDTSSADGLAMMDDLLSPPAKSYGKLQVGDDVVFVHQLSDYIAFQFVDCTRSFLTNLTVHTWPGMAVNMLRDTDVVIDALQVIPDPQRPWPVTTTADAIHLVNISGSVQVEACHLEGMMDDGFNSYSDILEPSQLQRAIAGALDLDARHAGWIFSVGSVWEFYDSNMISLGTATLQKTSTNRPGADVHELDFGSIPTGIAYVCNLSQFPSSTDMHGTAVLRNRGNGFRLRRDAIVSECSFEGLSGSGLQIGPSVGYWNEGPGGGNIEVFSSMFQSCNRGWGLYDNQEGTINISTAKLVGQSWTTLPVGSIQSIYLSDLTILDSGGAAVTCRSAEDVTIDNCTFGSTSSLGALPNLDALAVIKGVFAAQSLLFFHQTSNITITNNEVQAGATILNGDRTTGWIYGYYNKANNVGF